MQTPWRSIARTALVVGLGVGVAYGADQTILGLSFLAKDTGQPTRRRVVVKARETSSPNTFVSDPTTGGATLTLTANGGTPTTQTFTLPAANWRGDATRGFKYRDATGTAGAIKLVAMKLTRNGRFLVKILATGKTGTVSIVPPNPGTDACALIAIGGGDSYSIRFGPDSQISNKDGRLFRAKRPALEGSCVTTTTTSTSTSHPSTTSTTLYGSPSRAFLGRVTSLVD